MVSDAIVGYICSYPCPSLMMEAVTVSEILEMCSSMIWLTACEDFSAPYVVGFVFYFYLGISFFSYQFITISAVLSQKKTCCICFGSWKTKQYSLRQCLSTGRCSAESNCIVSSFLYCVIQGQS